MQKKEIFLYFQAILLFVVFGPYFTWTSALSTYSFILFSLTLLPYCKINKGKNVLIIIFLFFIKIFIDIFHNVSVSSIVGILLLVFLYVDPSYRLKVLQKFKTLVAILFLCSLITYVLVVFLGLDLPYTTIAPLNQGKNYVYNNYYLVVIPSNVKDIQLIFRFHAFFEEPGNVSSIVTTLLLMDRFKINSWKNVILFISGIVTFSLFFYVVALIFFIIRFKEYFNKKIILPIVGILLILSGLFYNNQTDIDLTRLIYNRIKIKDGNLGGNNRSSEVFDREYELLDSSGFFWGKGLHAHMKIAPGIQTYKMIIYDYGVIYMLLSILPMILYGLVICKKDYKFSIIYIVYILIFYYQRPAFMYTPGVFYLLTCLPFSLLKNQNLKNTVSVHWRSLVGQRN